VFPVRYELNSYISLRCPSHASPGVSRFMRPFQRWHPTAMNVCLLLKTRASLTTGFHLFFFIRISRYSVRTCNERHMPVPAHARTVSLFGRTSGRFLQESLKRKRRSKLSTSVPQAQHKTIKFTRAKETKGWQQQHKLCRNTSTPL
jgi:hypothetical protein